MSKETDNGAVTLEDRFPNLAKIVAQMEDQNVSLDESFELYKKGLDEVKHANEMLEGIEKAMLVIGRDGQLEEF